MRSSHISLPRSGWGLVHGVSASLLLVGGCSLTINAERRQCTRDADCTGRGEAFAGTICVNSLCELEPKWGCLERPPSLAPQLLGPFKVSLHLQDIVSEEALPGVTARLCRKRDEDCASPEGSAVSDADGDVTFEIPAGFTNAFNGYVMLTRDDLLPGLYFFNPPIVSDRDVSAVQLSTQNIAHLLAKQVGSELAPDRGLVLLTSVDCQNQAAPGVSYSSDDDTATTFYSVAGLPDTSATATDANGFGGLVNVHTGAVAISSKLNAHQRSLGTINLLVKAGSVTYSRVVPLGN